MRSHKNGFISLLFVLFFIVSILLPFSALAVESSEDGSTDETPESSEAIEEAETGAETEGSDEDEVIAPDEAALPGQTGTAGEPEEPEPPEAAEAPVLPAEDIISVEFPTAPVHGLDFILDPKGMIEATSAERYGNIPFEAGATVFFTRDDGSFSSRSEYLTVTNYSTCPVVITIRAGLSSLGDIAMAKSDNFSSTSAAPSLYMALVDSDGFERPIGDGEDAVRSVVLAENEGFSFALRGACDPNGDWGEISVAPVVSVFWEAEPILSELHEPEPVKGDEVDEEDEEGEEAEKAGDELATEIPAYFPSNVMTEVEPRNEAIEDAPSAEGSADVASPEGEDVQLPEEGPEDEMQEEVPGEEVAAEEPQEGPLTERLDEEPSTEQPDEGSAERSEDGAPAEEPEQIIEEKNDNDM